MTDYLLLQRYAEIKDAYIPKDYHSGRSKGFGFVEFWNEELISIFHAD
jgi:RNA recognition motif-containing protein